MFNIFSVHIQRMRISKSLRILVNEQYKILIIWKGNYFLNIIIHVYSEKFEVGVKYPS